jgi:hypothetical protein
MSNHPNSIILGMPSDEYHASIGLGSSGLKRLAKSPLHYRDTPPIDPTPAMRNGTLTHCVLLEPDTVDDRYVVKPFGLDGRTKEGKAWAATVPAGVEVISDDQLRAAECQADRLRSMPDVGSLLAAGNPEVSAFWVDEETGELCKCRPDWVAPAGDGVILVDVKTCQDASPTGFAKACANMRYHLQAAWYAEGYEKASGQRVLGFVFACVESEAPYATAAYMLDDAAMELGRAENRRLLGLYAACKASNDWPGYSPTIEPLSLPSWAFP